MRCSSGRGFTLVELLVGLTLLGLVSVAYYGINRETQHPFAHGERRADMQQDGGAMDSLPPVNPMGLTVTPSCGTLVIKWRRNPEIDVTGYRLFYDTDGALPYTGTGAAEGASPIYVGPDTTCMLTNLNRSLTYTVAVRAQDALLMESGFSATGSGRPADTTAPPGPTGIMVRVTGDSAVAVSWNRSPAADVQYYRLYYDRDAPGTPYALSDTTSATTKSLSGLVTGAMYYFAVVAVDRCGNTSVLSEEVSTRPVLCSGDTPPPARPTVYGSAPGGGEEVGS